MKITLEFSSIKDLLIQMPKFAQLIGGEGSSGERIAAALEEEAPVLKITSTDGEPFTEEEKEKIKEVISETARRSAENAPEEKPKKEEPMPSEASETEARAALNGLVKARSNAAVKLVFKKLGVSNFGELTEAAQYAEALTLADWVNGMTDEEYAAALKEAGIKGGRK